MSNSIGTPLDGVTPETSSPNNILQLMPVTLGAAALAACGGGGGSGETPPPAPPPPAPPTAEQAARFLTQASMGPTREQIARVQSLGYRGWLEEQFALPRATSRWDWLVQKGFDAATYRNSEAGFDAAAWRKLIASPDTLRQRVTLALSEIFVAAIDGFIGSGWRSFSAAAYLDMLEANAFGTYRNLLQVISTSAAMGEYLTFRGNVRYNAATGALPDENYAREIMQLFSIGLYQLNLDGTPALSGGKAQETYAQDDIAGLARVFTGWDYDLAGGDTSTPEFKRRPMVQIAGRHETGAKAFLGLTIPAGTDGVASLNQALDFIATHANVAPFISRQLIQRLVCSNPSPGYVARVAAVFNDNGSKVRGDLKAVVTAILLDDDARGAAGLTDPAFGKLREPMLRFIGWARAYNANSASDAWAIGDTTDAGTRLGQSPLRSPTVFNYFRPGYVPPNTAIGSAGLVAPEFQITNESTVVGYVNYMQTAVSRGVGDVVADYASLVTLADNAASLIDELNVVLAAGALSASTLSTLKTAIVAMPVGTDTARSNRIYAALLLVLASPEYIVQK